MNQPSDLPLPRSSDEFYSGAFDRLRRFMLVLGVVFSLAFLAWPGWRFAAGFAVGCTVAWINFHWLKRTISDFADRVTEARAPRSSAGMVLRFLLRYVLLAAVAYAIFRSSATSLYGLLFGLSLPVAAIFCEAVYVAWMALRRGL